MALFALSACQDPAVPAREAAGTKDKDPEALSAVPMGEVVKALTPHQAMVEECYQRGRTFNPFFGGDLVLRVIVGKEGQVEGVKVLSSTMDEKAYVDCAMELFQGLTFDPSSERRSFEYPLKVKRARPVTRMGGPP